MIALILTVCPHAAFEHPETPANARLRESIECLVYVIYPQRRNDTNEADIDVSLNRHFSLHCLTDTTKLLP